MTAEERDLFFQLTREYQREAFNLFDDLLDSVRESVTQLLMRVEMGASRTRAPKSC